MNTRKWCALAVGATVLVVGGIAANEAATATRTLDLPIAGMHCESCAASLAKRLSEAAGVKAVSVSFDERVARLTVARWGGPSAETLGAVVAEAGYEVGDPR